MIAAAGAEFFTGLFGTLLTVGILALVIAWVIFPFIVITKFNDLLKVEREAMNARREIAKALQWMVDNWRDEGSKPPPPV
jgi:hypothetical protein